MKLQRPEPKGQKGIFLAAEVAEFWYTHKAFVRIALLVSFFLYSFKNQRQVRSFKLSDVDFKGLSVELDLKCT